MSLYPRDYKVPQYIAIAVAEDDSRLTNPILPETERRLYGNKYEGVDVAREKLREWANVRADEGEKVFIYTLDTTVVKKTETCWDGKISAEDPMRTDMN